MADTDEHPGNPVYMTVNATELTDEIRETIKKVQDKANDLHSVFYLTINSGKPIYPPPH